MALWGGKKKGFFFEFFKHSLFMHIKKNQSSSNLFKRTVDSTDDFRPPRRGGGDVAPSVECLVTRTVYRCTHDIILKQKYVKYMYCRVVILIDG